MSGEAVVSRDGKIKLWGTEIDVLGVGLDDLKKKITAELAKFFAVPPPPVSVAVKEIRSRAVIRGR